MLGEPRLQTSPSPQAQECLPGVTRAGSRSGPSLSVCASLSNPQGALHLSKLEASCRVGRARAKAGRLHRLPRQVVFAAPALPGSGFQKVTPPLGGRGEGPLRCPGDMGHSLGTRSLSLVPSSEGVECWTMSFQASVRSQVLWASAVLDAALRGAQVITAGMLQLSRSGSKALSPWECHP